MINIRKRWINENDTKRGVQNKIYRKECQSWPRQEGTPFGARAISIHQKIHQINVKTVRVFYVLLHSLK